MPTSNLDLRQNALRAACAWAAQHPEVASFGHASDARTHQFAASRDLQRYLRSARSSRSRFEHTEELLVTAHSWLTDGQSSAIVAAFARHVTSPAYQHLRDADRLLHKAVFILALRDGPRPRASFAYLATLLEAEFGHRTSPSTVGRMLTKLQQAGLVEVTVGKRSPGRTKSTVICLRAQLTPSPPASIEALLALTMSLQTSHALEAYAPARQDVQHTAPAASWSAPAPAQAGAGGSGPGGLILLQEAPGGPDAQRIPGLAGRTRPRCRSGWEPRAAVFSICRSRPSPVEALHMPKPLKEVDLSPFTAVMAEALNAYGLDSAYAVAMAETGSGVLVKRQTWSARKDLRRAEASAREACERSELTSCELIEPCGIAACPYAPDTDVRDLVGVPAVAPGISSKARATRPQPRTGPDYLYAIESAVQPLRDLRERRGTLPDVTACTADHSNQRRAQATASKSAT